MRYRWSFILCLIWRQRDVQIDSPVGTVSGKGKLGYRTSHFFVLSLDFVCVAFLTWR